jgi:hypothetical protein
MDCDRWSLGSKASENDTVSRARMCRLNIRWPEVDSRERFDSQTGACLSRPQEINQCSDGHREVSNIDSIEYYQKPIDRIMQRAADLLGSHLKCDNDHVMERPTSVHMPTNVETTGTQVKDQTVRDDYSLRLRMIRNFRSKSAVG